MKQEYREHREDKEKGREKNLLLNQSNSGDAQAASLI